MAVNRRASVLTVLAAAAFFSAGCSASTTAGTQPGGSAGTTSRATTRTAPATSAVALPATATPTPPSSTGSASSPSASGGGGSSASSSSSTSPHHSVSPSHPPRGRAAALPRGGHRILGHYRVVAYYGGPDGPALGVLGSADPDTIAEQIIDRAQEWRGYGLPVQPAMELIASVAQAGPGPYGLYSAPIPDEAVQRYLDAAHRHKMLLVLDIQPGRGEFLPQVEHFARFLKDPSVSVALDPEWKMGPGEVPGTVIGSSSAASVLAVRDYLARVVAVNRLPDKLLVVHQFTLSMLPDRSGITPRRGIEVVFHADGFGTQSEKIGTWRALGFPGRPFGAGFKLFLRDDTALLSPDQVMQLRPRPDVITYQ
jgi:hypothetical protein